MMGDSTPPKLKKILPPKTLLLLLSPPPPPKQEQEEEQQQPHRRREIRQRMPNILFHSTPSHNGWNSYLAWAGCYDNIVVVHLLLPHGLDFGPCFMLLVLPMS